MRRTSNGLGQVDLYMATNAGWTRNEMETRLRAASATKRLAGLKSASALANKIAMQVRAHITGLASLWRQASEQIR